MEMCGYDFVKRDFKASRYYAGLWFYVSDIVHGQIIYLFW